LYDLNDVKRTTPLFTSQPPNQWLTISDSIQVRFRHNGHIIGATFIEIKTGDKTIVFSGDIGRTIDSLLNPPDLPEEADVLIMESTYGDRIHSSDSEEQLTRTINESSGTILIPSFAVERTQSLMFLLWKLRKRKVIRDIPVYMDSPMGRNVLEIFHHHPYWHKLSRNECTEMCNDFIRVTTMDETLKLAADKNPKIIIAGSGMATGGRILTYFERSLGDKTCTLLLVGYQAEGTRGRQLLDGAAEIKLHGKHFAVRATIRNIDGLSAHADQAELIHWLSKLNKAPKHIFITHGEPSSSQALRKKILETYGWGAVIPQLDEVVEL
jgi:metallo-beta-lactamase family protein